MEAEQKSSKQDIIQIHAGTYEGKIIGFEGTLRNLESKYYMSSALGSIKSMEVCSKFLFVGGSDETIRIYNIKKYNEIGLLTGHQGSIQSIKSYKNMIVSCSDDEKIIVWKNKEWAQLVTLKEHKTPVLDLAIHSSGKIMLSISKDNKMIIWNLLNAKKVFQKKFTFNAFKVSFFLDDKYICLLSDRDVKIVNSSNNQVIQSLLHNKKLSEMIVFNKYVLTGDDKGTVYIWDCSQELSEDKHPSYISFEAHEMRVKQMRILAIDNMNILATISSNGEIKFWDCLYLIQQIDQVKENKSLGKSIQPIYNIQTKERLTSFAINICNREEGGNEDEDENQNQNQLEEKESKELIQSTQSEEKPKKKNKKHGKRKNKRQKELKEQEQQRENKNKGNLQQKQQVEQKKLQKQSKKIKKSKNHSQHIENKK